MCEKHTVLLSFVMYRYTLIISLPFLFLLYFPDELSQAAVAGTSRGRPQSPNQETESSKEEKEEGPQ